MRLAHRCHSSATPAQVWQLLGAPSRWPEFDPFLRRLPGAPERARTGQSLLAVARLTGLRVPVDVVDAEPEQRLELLVHLAPGLSQRLVYELTPALAGGCSVRVGVVVEGLLARLAVAPVWLYDGLVARVLVAQVERSVRARRDEQGAA